MPRDDAHLLDILKAARLAIEFKGPAEKADFLEDAKTQVQSAEEAFRRAYPTVTDFKMFPWGTSPAPVWVVAGSETYVVNYSGGPGLNSWFAHPAKYVGCYTPEPRTPRPSGLPSAAPTTFG